MPKSPHIDFLETDSQDLGVLESVSLPPEPPDIRNWFSSYVYESPELDQLDCFEGLGGAEKTFIKEENTRKSGYNLPVGENECAGVVKSSSDRRTESKGSECCKSADVVSGSSESLVFSEEPPDIRNWFSSYVYESPPLDSALDFGISFCGVAEAGKLYVEEKSVSRNTRDTTASFSVEKIESGTLKNTSDVVVEFPNMVEGTKLDNQSACKDDDDDDDDVDLQSLPSTLNLSSSDKISDRMLSRQRAGYSNHKSLEKIGSTNTCGDGYDGMLHSTFSSRNPIPLNMENNIGSRDRKSVYRPTEGTDSMKDEDIYTAPSPPNGDSWRSIGKENESELLEDGFISIRKKSRLENRENVARIRNGVPMVSKEMGTNIEKKVLHDISNLHSQNILATTGKWSCPRKKKPDLGPPLMQLRLDQWVRRA